MAKTVKYQTLQQELEQVLAALQAPDVQIDDAVQLYEQGLTLVAALQQHLAKAENKITRLAAGPLASPGRQV